MRRLFIILVLLTGINVFAAQQRVTISRGFFTGKEYFEMSESEKRAYATGAVNGMLVSPFFGASEDRVAWLKTCTAKLSDEETAGILTRYINGDPSQQSLSLNVVTFNALKDACDRMK